MTEAYIPLRRENTRVGSSCLLRPPTQNLPENPKKMRNPNASQWNKGCVGFQMQNSRVGHVHFLIFVSISFALGPVFQWNMGFRYKV